MIKRNYFKVAENNFNGTCIFLIEISYSSNGIALKRTFLLCHLN